MQINEKVDEKSVTVEFIVHRSIVKTATVLHFGNPNDTQVSQWKLKIIDELCDYNTGMSVFRGKNKEMLKEWSKHDEHLAKVYALMYPRGGYRGGGRPKGSFTKSKPKTNKTERIKPRCYT